MLFGAFNFLKEKTSGAAFTRYKQQSFLVLVGFIALLGVFLRVYQYAVNRSLWVDEAMLALNIVNRPFAELTKPLGFDQGAPIGFLFLEKAIIQLFGNRDYILRLFPLVAGIIGILLIYKVSRDYSVGLGVLIAVAVLAFSKALIYQASELKQYSSDAMFTLLLLFVAYKCLDNDAQPKRFAVLVVVGIFAMWTSHPALFIILGISLSLGLGLLLRKDWRRIAWLGVVLLLFLVNFGVIYIISLRFLASDPGLVDTWRSAFMPMPPWRDLAWLSNAVAYVVKYPFDFGGAKIPAAIAMVACLLGLISLFVRRWQLALFLATPVLFALLASGLEKYPFTGRLLIFTVPLVLVLIAEGVERVRLTFLRLDSRIALVVWTVLSISLLYRPISAAYEKLQHPSMREHIKPVMSYMSDRRLETDQIYVYYGAEPAFQYYAPFYKLEDSDYVVGVTSREEPDRYLQDIAGLKGHKRVWFVFSHNCAGCTVNEEVYFLEHLDEIGSRMDELQSQNASVYLYDLSGREP